MLRFYSIQKVKKGLLFLMIAGWGQCLIAQPVLTFTSRINTGLAAPIDLVHANDGSNRIFIAEQAGTIKTYSAAHSFISDFLTVTGLQSGGEQGLLSIAFHPNYANTDPAIGGFFYVYYTNTAGDLEIARYHISADPNVADASSKVIVLTIPHPTNTNHNGGKLNFGADGFLYLGTGDGGSSGDPANNAQRGDVLLGKMIRIDVTNSATAPYYTIPASNPYVGAGDPLDEIFAMGLRNPFRWSFDRATNAMWIGDVGQNVREEINYSPMAASAGVNYGWRCYEGNDTYNTTGCGPSSNYQSPVYDYLNPAGSSASVCGGVVYRGNQYPTLQGYYIFSDIYSGNVYLTNTGSFTTTIQTGLPGFIVCYGETESGEVYAVSLNGTVYSVEASGALPVTLTLFSATAQAGYNELKWETSFENAFKKFDIEYSTNGNSFENAGSVAALNQPSGSKYTFKHTLTLSGEAFYRLKLIDQDGTFTYSNAVRLHSTNKIASFINPNIVNRRILRLQLNEPWESIEIINMAGQRVHQQKINRQTGLVQVALPSIPTGTYIAILRNRNIKKSQRIVVMD